MRLLENGHQIKFMTYDGTIHQKNVKDIHPIFNARLLEMSKNPKIKNLNFQFHCNNELFLVEALAKTSENIDIVESLIHGILFYKYYRHSYYSISRGSRGSRGSW